MEEKKTRSSQLLESDVSNSYKAFHIFVFKRLPVILVLVLAGILAYYYVFLGSKDKNNIVDRTEIEAPIKENYRKLYTTTLQHDAVQTIIKDGYLAMKDTVLTSVWNLIKVKGWNMPNMVNTNIDSLPEMRTFAKTWYDINQLEALIKDIILDGQASTPPFSVSRTLLTVENIEEQFSLSCLKGVKLNTYLCDKYVESFLDVMHLYRLDTIPEQLKEMYTHLDTEQQQKFCLGMEKFILFSHTDNGTIGEVIRKCGKSHFAKYLSYKTFYTAKKGIIKWGVSESMNTSHDINMYLILSLQQSIAKNITRARINVNSIHAYLDLVEKVMLRSKNTAIAPIYYDWVFWFNEYILKEGLQKARYSQSNLQSDIEMIIPKILKIDNGNQAIWIPWLRDSLLNPAVAELGKNIGTSKLVHLDALQRITDFVNDLSFFVFTKNAYKENTDQRVVNVMGYIIIQYEGKNYNLNTTLEMDASSFRILHVTIDWYPVFNTALNKLLKNNFFSLPDLYQYINKNLKFYFDNEQISFCSLVQKTFWWVSDPFQSQENEHNKKYQVFCSPEKVRIVGEETTYTIGISWFSVQTITVSDPVLQDALTQHFIKDTTSDIDLVGLIEGIVYYTPEEKEKVYTGSTKVIVVLDKIREYMNIKATDVIEQGDIILAEIIVQDIPFIIHYDFETDTIKTVFFKGIRVAPWSEHFLKVPSFNLTLSKENQSNINVFLIEPLEYIKKKNPYIYLQYLKLTK